MVKKRIALTENILTITMADNVPSIVIDKSHYKNMLIIMPATWTAADITFTVSSTKTGSFSKLVHAETDTAPKELRLKDPVASQAIAITGKMKEILEACPFIKLRSGTFSAPIAQGASRTFTIILSG